MLVYNGARKQDGYGTSISILCPQGHCLQLMRRFSYSGCKPIGEREYKKLMLECWQRVFPYDYPGTQAFKLEAERSAYEQVAKYAGRPPSKRCNFLSLK